MKNLRMYLPIIILGAAFCATLAVLVFIAVEPISKYHAKLEQRCRDLTFAGGSAEYERSYVVYASDGTLCVSVKADGSAYIERFRP